MVNTFDITKMQTGIKITQHKIPSVGHVVRRCWTNHEGERMFIERMYLDHQTEDLHRLTRDWGKDG